VSCTPDWSTALTTEYRSVMLERTTRTLFIGSRTRQDARKHTNMLKSNDWRRRGPWDCPGLPRLLLLLALATAETAVAEAPKVPGSDRDRLPQIIGGAPSAPQSYPWMVALMDSEFLSNSDPFLAQYCGGTLISQRWVLTTAHCLFDPSLTNLLEPSQIKVLVGTNDLLSGEGQVLDVERVVPHPNFSSDLNTVEADLGLIELATPASADPIPLNRLADNPLASEGSLAWITGWGSRAFDDGTPSDFPPELHEAQVPLLSVSSCQERYPSTGLSILDSHLCAGFPEGGVDTCIADSGGPIFLSDGEGEFLQLGITSAGEGCAGTFPGVYTRISSYIQWIDENTASDLYFAQFGDGQGFSSEMVLFNPSSVAGVRGTVIFRDGPGNTVEPASILSPEAGLLGANSETDFDLAPLGSVTFTTTGTSTTLISGSAEVVTNGDIAGVIRFQSPGVGIAGVGSSTVASSVIAPVRRKGALSTGVAIRNTLQSELVVDLSLKQQDGVEIANGNTQLTIPSQGHKANFLEELFPEADTQDFQGTICIRSSDGRLAVVAIELGSEAGEFTTLPVTVLDAN